MSLIPFFSALFLLINPALLGLFRRFDQNLQKLQFWAMLTSGTAWLISLSYLFLKPEYHLNPIWDAGVILLPSLAFSLDWVSSSYFLAVTTLIFFGILVEDHTPETIAWITGLGGVCVIGTLVDSAYTLALVWTMIEGFVLYGFLKNQGEMATNRRHIFVILVRLISPLLVIYISAVNSSTGTAPFLTELPSSAAPFLLIAGVIGFGGWFLTPRVLQKEHPVINPGKYLSWTPAALGLVLLTRGAQIFTPEDFSPGIILAISLLVVLAILGSVLVNSPETNWKIGNLGLFIAGFTFAAPHAILTWGAVFFLPGLVLFRDHGSKRTASLALIIGGIGILTLPFLPTWVGLAAVKGLSGFLFSAITGVFLGKIINHQIQIWREIEYPTEQISPLIIIGYAVVLISQFSLAIQAGLIKTSLAFSAVPISAWIAALLFGFAVLFWDRIPRIQLSWVDNYKQKSSMMIDMAAKSFPRLADGAVYLFTRLFEGDGGLIWTLLLGFLIITLISIRGG